MEVPLRELSDQIVKYHESSEADRASVLELTALVAIAERLEGLTDGLKEIANMIQKGK